MKRYAFYEGLKEVYDKKYKKIIIVISIIAIAFAIYTASVLPDGDIDLNTFSGMIIATFLILFYGMLFYVFLIMTKTRNMFRDELIIYDNGIKGKYCINYGSFEPKELCFTAKYDDILRVELEIIKNTRFARGYFLIIHCKTGIYRLNIPDAFGAKTDIEFNMQHSIHL